MHLVFFPTTAFIFVINIIRINIYISNYIDYNYNNIIITLENYIYVLVRQPKIDYQYYIVYNISKTLLLLYTKIIFACLINIMGMINNFSMLQITGRPQSIQIERQIIPRVLLFD